MTEGPIKQIISVQYNVPRYVIAEPGKQNRACTGNMRITPGIAEPFEFQYTNSDGVPINLSGFTITLVFWYSGNEYDNLPANLTSATGIIYAKHLSVDDSYKGKCTVLLTDQDTLAIGQNGRSSIRWSIYMLSDEGNMFATQITQNGDRYGICNLGPINFPSAEIIKGISIAPNQIPPPMFIESVGQQVNSQSGSLTITII
jgi:hypothetical protein